MIGLTAAKAEPPVAPWTGFYGGANLGYGWTPTNNINIAFAQSTGGPGFNTFAATDRGDMNGASGGAQVGYNWQSRWIVYGVETDWQVTNQRRQHAFDGTIFVPDVFGSPDINPVTVSSKERLTWFGTLRARAGAVIADRFLAYVTGGLAYGEVELSGFVLPGNPDPVIQQNLPGTWQENRLKVGWAIGGGVESRLVGNWTLKVEYLYIDLGKISANGALPAGNCYGTGGACNGPLPFPGPGTINGPRVTDNIVRLGVNYRFTN